MSWLRRFLIELWAMVVLSALVGFLGPFGTYLDGEFPFRTWHWWMQLMGAYVLVRPSILLWEAIAGLSSLPPRLLVFWGVFMSSFPLALLWEWSANAFFDDLNGFAGILPFAILCALGVLAVTEWARKADERLRREFGIPVQSTPTNQTQETEKEVRNLSVPYDRAEQVEEGSVSSEQPRLLCRLNPGFQGPILALQSEDHYVRVHGMTGSELVFMRLRDAINEMDPVPGQHVHRSWWIAEGGIVSVDFNGRKRTVRLANGVSAPIARDSVSRLESAGFIRSGQL